MAKKMTQNMKNTTQQSGVTLIELLIAVTISSVLLIGVGSVYYNSKRTYMVQEEFAQLQEGARIAVKFMVEDIRIAGFVGCAFNNDYNDISSNPRKFESFLNNAGSPENDDATDNFGMAISGFEATATGPNTVVDLGAPPVAYTGAILPAYFTTAPNPAPLPGSDIIIARYADGNGSRISQTKTDPNFTIRDLTPVGDPPIDGNGCNVASSICVGSLLIATDCEKSRLFQATALAAVGPDIVITHDNPGGAISPGNATILWGGANRPDSSFEPDDTYLYRAKSVAYYIANNPTGVPSLHRLLMEPGAVADELITGVENMQILYGVDAEKILTDTNILNDRGDGIANSYVTANAIVPANENVVSVRVSLLLRTTKQVSTKSTAAPVTQNYLLAGINAADGTTITSPADRLIRKVFTTTVKLRNKGLQ